MVFVHPGSHPPTKQVDLPWPFFMMEYLFDTTRAVVNLVFGGALERYPRIRFILPHVRRRGMVPYFSWRFSAAPMIFARLNQCSARSRCSSCCGDSWYDNALSPGDADLGLPGKRRVARPEIVFGTDWPFANVDRHLAAAMQAYGESLLARHLFRGTAAISTTRNAPRLFPQFA